MATVNSTASSQVAYSYLQSKNKIGGLVSGMDIDSIMEKLMKAENAQMEKLQQQKQKYEWKRDAYREVNTKLNTFQQDLFDKYTMKSSWNSKSVTTTPNSAINVKATASASGNLTVSEVKTATNASALYTSGGVAFEKVTGSTTLTHIQGLTDESNNQISSLNIFGEDLATFDAIINKLNSNGYNATLNNGQLKITAGSDAKVIDGNTKQSLEKLGFNFGTSLTSEKIKANNTDITTTTKLSEIQGVDLKNLQINGQDINVDEDATVSELIKEIKNQGFSASLKEGKLTISNTDGSEITMASQDSGSLIPEFGSALSGTTSSTFVTKIPDGAIKPPLTSASTIQEVLGGDAEDSMFTLRSVQADGTTKDTTITYKATDTISSLMSKINSSGAGVTAIFNDGKFNISSNNTGVRNGDESAPEISLLSNVTDEDGFEVPITDATHKLFSTLMGGTGDLNDSSQIHLTSDGEVEYTLADGGSKASITVNGVEYEQNSNVFNVAGYEITASSNLSDGNVSITSTTDTDKAIDKVKEFVTMYNDLLKELNDKTSQKKKVGYDPLTDAQKAEMNDSEIEKWETAAKEGLLKGDTTLNTVLSNMRQTIFNYGNTVGVSKVQGAKGDTLASIGITSSATWKDNGKLEIDENKLRAAIEKDPDVLSRIFTGDGTEENPGIVSQIRSTAQAAVKTIEKSAGKESIAENQYSIGKTISSLTTKIDDWKDRLKTIEDRYWKQFSAMETAIQRANSQSSIFSQ